MRRQVSGSEPFRSRQVGRARMGRDKIDVLPHFQRVDEGSPVPANVGAPVLYFGRLSAEKGVSDLLHAVSRSPGIPLKIAGDGAVRLELEGLARKLGLRNVEFAGHVQGPGLDRLIDDLVSPFFPRGPTRPGQDNSRVLCARSRGDRVGPRFSTGVCKAWRNRPALSPG